MQFSEKWLRTMVDPELGTDALAHLLTMSGLEVEACDPVAPTFHGVVVAQVRAIAPHPNADKLYLMKVDIGRTITMVSGLKDHYTADELKKKTLIIVTNLEPATIRGVKSEGMLLAAEEGKQLALLPHSSILTSATCKRRRSRRRPSRGT